MDMEFHMFQKLNRTFRYKCVAKNSAFEASLELILIYNEMPRKSPTCDVCVLFPFHLNDTISFDNSLLASCSSKRN